MNGNKSKRKLVFALLAAATLAGACATAPASAPGSDVIVTADWRQAYDDFHYAPAVRAGDFLFLSGVVAGYIDATETDETAAYTRAFDAIGAILEAGGAGWEHVVEIETFHTDLPAQINAFAAVKDRYIATPYTTWTAIDVDRLFPDLGLVEIKVTAYLGAPRKLEETQ